MAGCRIDSYIEGICYWPWSWLYHILDGRCTGGSPKCGPMLNPDTGITLIMMSYKWSVCMFLLLIIIIEFDRLGLLQLQSQI